MCQFSIPFTGDIHQLIHKANQGIQKVGGSFNGNESGGQFNVKSPMGLVAGSFSVQGQLIIIDIQKKPFLVSCRRIEKELRQVMV